MYRGKHPNRTSLPIHEFHTHLRKRVFVSRPLPSSKSVYRSKIKACFVDNVTRVNVSNSKTDFTEGGLHGLAFLPVTRSFSGATNPNWKDKVRHGVNATTAMVGIDYDWDLGWLSTLIERSKDSIGFYAKHEIYGYPSILQPGIPSLPSSVSTDVSNRALRKFLNACQSALSAVEAGQDLGEYKETLNGLKHPLGSLRNHVLAYFPKAMKAIGKTRTVGHALKALADTYLEWTFGWKPLASDIADAYEALRNNQHFPTVPVHGNASGSWNGSSNLFFGYTSSGSLTIDGCRKSSATYTVMYRGAVRTEAAPNGHVGLAQNLQLLPENWLPTAWDLLPYSFIADYFINIGDVISSFSFPASHLAWGCLSTRTIATDEYHYCGKEANPFAGETILQWLAGGARSMGRASKVTRSQVNPSDLLARVQFRIPFSSKVWENLGALMTANARPIVTRISQLRR